MAHNDHNLEGSGEMSAPVGDNQPRRRFLTTASGSAMAAGLLGAYGTFGYMQAVDLVVGQASCLPFRELNS